MTRPPPGLLQRGFRIALIAGHDDGDGMRAVYLFTAGPGQPGRAARALDPDDPHVPSLAALSFPAGRFEREMRDLFGIVPVGHPLPRRLVRHFHWPRGWYPMRPTPATRRRSATSTGRTRSAPSKAPASTRSRSARCTPG